MAKLLTGTVYLWRGFYSLLANTFFLISVDIFLFGYCDNKFLPHEVVHIEYVYETQTQSFGNNYQNVLLLFKQCYLTIL